MDNSSRVISTVAIRAQRYSGWSLSDMRLHDINIVADLTAHDPNDPYPCDGTCYGQQESVGPESINLAETVVDGLLSAVSSFWDLINNWPTLFFSVIKSCETVFDILISMDILGNVQVHTMEMDCLADNSYSDGELDQCLNLEYIDWHAAGVYLTIWLMEIALSYSLDALRFSSYSIQVTIALIAVWFVAFLGYLALLFHSYDSGLNSSIELFIATAVFVLMILGSTPVFPEIKSGSRLFRALLKKPLFLVFVISITGYSYMDLIVEMHFAFAFPVMLLEIIVLVILGFMLGYWFALFIQGY